MLVLVLGLTLGVGVLTLGTGVLTLGVGVLGLGVLTLGAGVLTLGVGTLGLDGVFELELLPPHAVKMVAKATNNPTNNFLAFIIICLLLNINYY